MEKNNQTKLQRKIKELENLLFLSKEKINSVERKIEEIIKEFNNN